MTPTSGSGGDRDYLWDPQSTPDPDVESVERALAPLRFRRRRQPLSLPRQKRRAVWTRPLFAIAASVALVMTVAAAYWFWRQSWPAGKAWAAAVQETNQRSPIDATLALNRPLHLGEQSSARVQIARIGEMIVDPGSAVTLIETTSARHRIAIDRGAVRVRVWAPPGRFGISTPAGTVIDLGCIFDLSVDAAGTSVVRVQTGWVQLNNAWGESLIPAGTSAMMTSSMAPTVPIHDAAAPAFASSVRAFERASDEAARSRLVKEINRTAGPGDVLTLLMVSKDASPSIKRALLERAAELRPPPAGVTVEAAVADRERVWDWAGSLGLPPVKSWWLNWRDLFRRADR